MAKKTLAEKMAENSKTVLENLKTNTIGSFSSTETIKKNIIILDELRDLIPPLLASELLALKDNLQKHGCKDPLKVWQTSNKVLNRANDSDEPIYVLVDGHNRYKLCNELQIPFNIQIDNFESLKEVRDFMIDFQLSRRNITAQQASYLRGLRYNTEKKEVVDNFKIGDFSPDGHSAHLEKNPLNSDDFVRENKGQIDTNLPDGHSAHLANKAKKTTTAQELGDYFSVDEKTIRRDAAFALGLEKLEANVRKEILAGKLKISKKQLEQLGKIKEITEPLTSLQAIEAALNVSEKQSLISNNSFQDDTVVKVKFTQLTQKLQKIYTAKTVKPLEINALRIAFDAFIEALQ
jgi:hypothetical protein